MDANATDRVLLQSFKPSLHTNADCNALVAAVVSRQIFVVRLLLKVKKLFLILLPFNASCIVLLETAQY